MINLEGRQGNGDRFKNKEQKPVPAVIKDAEPVFVPVYISFSDGTMLQTRKNTPISFVAIPYFFL